MFEFFVKTHRLYAPCFSVLRLTLYHWCRGKPTQIEYRHCQMNDGPLMEDPIQIQRAVECRKRRILFLSTVSCKDLDTSVYEHRSTLESCLFQIDPCDISKTDIFSKYNSNSSLLLIHYTSIVLCVFSEGEQV
jgi:hypothetical protein